MAKDSFSRNITISIIAHVGLLAFFTIKTFLNPSESIVFQDAIRVDIVSLPDKISEIPIEKIPKEKIKEIKKKDIPLKKETVKPTPPKPKKKISLKKNKNNQNDALRKLKTLNALKALKEKAKQAEVTQSKEIIYKGNRLSAGSELTGINKLQHDVYLSTLKNHIKSKWFLPEWLKNKELSAKILIKIGENGQILEKKLIMLSGNKEFDNLVENTINKSLPLPQPPEKFINILSVNGLVLGFPK